MVYKNLIWRKRGSWKQNYMNTRVIKYRRDWKSSYCIGWPSSKSVQDSRHSGHLKWQCTHNCNWRISNKNIRCMLGAAVVGTKTELFKCFSRLFGTFSLQSEGLAKDHAPFDNRWSNLRWPLHSQNQTIIQQCYIGSPRLKKAKMVLSTGKVMATVYWDSQEIIFID